MKNKYAIALMGILLTGACYIATVCVLCVRISDLKHSVDKHEERPSTQMKLNKDLFSMIMLIREKNKAQQEFIDKANCDMYGEESS